MTDTVLVTAERRYPTPVSLGPLVRAVAPGHHRGGEGSHGITHWARVLENGLRLAPLTGASVAVVSLFAVFHDARRRSLDDDVPAFVERWRMNGESRRATG